MVCQTDHSDRGPPAKYCLVSVCLEDDGILHPITGIGDPLLRVPALEIEITYNFP